MQSDSDTRASLVRGAAMFSDDKPFLDMHHVKEYLSMTIRAQTFLGTSKVVMDLPNCIYEDSG